MVKQTKRIVKTTTSRGEFNRAYKALLENTRRIHCSHCGYHRGENNEKKWYGGYEKIRHPNWKLVSRNGKQWMKKPTKIEEKTSRWNGKNYIDITW